MKTHTAKTHGANAMTAPDDREEMSLRSCLGWLTAITPRGPAKEEAEWRFAEGERLDNRSLESLSLELHGY